MDNNKTMSALRRRSEPHDSNVAVRCSFTKGRCWQCTNPALPKRAFCRLHLGFDNDFELHGPEPGNSGWVPDAEEKSVRRKRRKRKAKEENAEIKVAGEEEEVKEIRKEFPFGVLTIAAPSSSKKFKNPVMNSGDLRKRTEDGGGQSKIKMRKIVVKGSSSEKVEPEKKSCETNIPTEAGNNITAVEASRTEVMLLSTKQVDLKKKCCETNIPTQAGNNITAVEASRTEVMLLSTKQVDLKKKSGETNIPTEAENNITAVEISGSEAMGLSTKQVDLKKKSCQTNIPPQARETANGVNGIEDNTDNQNKTVEGKIYYDVRQLLPILKQPSMEQTRELQIEAHNQGKGISEVQISVVECSYDGRFKCDSCQTKIENLHRSCKRCNYNLCIKCCQVIRAHLTEKDETVNRGGPITQKVVENKGKNIDCPSNPCGICGGDTVKIKCIVHIGWKEFAGATQ